MESAERVALDTVAADMKVFQEEFQETQTTIKNMIDDMRKSGKLAKYVRRNSSNLSEEVKPDDLVSAKEAGGNNSESDDKDLNEGFKNSDPKDMKNDEALDTTNSSTENNSISLGIITKNDEGETGSLIHKKDIVGEGKKKEISSDADDEDKSNTLILKEETGDVNKDKVLSNGREKDKLDIVDDCAEKTKSSKSLSTSNITNDEILDENNSKHPMELFVQNAESSINNAFARIEQAKQDFKLVLEYFGEDDKMTSPDFFGTIKKFIGLFDTTLELVNRLELMKVS